MKTIHVVGQMLVRNEADVIEEVVREAFRWVEALVVLDGASTDGTTGILSGLAATYRKAGKLLVLCSRDDPDGRFADHYRNELLELTSVLRPDWVMSVDGDEIYDAVPVTPVDAIAAAEDRSIGPDLVESRPERWRGRIGHNHLVVAFGKSGIRSLDLSNPA